MKQQAFDRRRWALTAAAFVLIGSAYAAEERAVTLCHEDEDVRPWLLKNGKGLNMVLLDKVAAKSNLRIEYKILPWKRCLADIEAGRVDGGFAASYKEERAQFAVYPGGQGKPDSERRLHSNTYSLYRLKGSRVDWDGTRFTHLDGPIGAQSGYSIIDELRNLKVDVDDGGKSSEANMQKLLRGRLQAVAALTLEGDKLLKDNPEFRSKIERVKTPLIDKPYFVIFGKTFYAANKPLVEEFWATVGKVRKSPEYLKQQTSFMKNNTQS